MSKFINNKYFKLYSRIIRNAQHQNREYDSFVHERHHMIPESLGGRQVVILTFREHFLCHLLLTKFTTGVNKAKMYFALQTFFYFDDRRRLNLQQRSRLYELYKAAFIEAANTRKQYGKSNGKLDTFTVRHKDTLKEFTGTRLEIKQHTGMTPQQLNYLLANPGITRHCLRWGIYDDTLDMWSTDIPRPKKQPNPKQECHHCHAVVVTANYNRWHGDNCKSIDPEGHRQRAALTASLAATRVAAIPTSSEI